jgi:hypothetical protein
VDAELKSAAESVPDNLAGWGVDVSRNAVVITVTGDDPEAMAFAEKWQAESDAAEIEHVAEAPRTLRDHGGPLHEPRRHLVGHGRHDRLRVRHLVPHQRPRADHGQLLRRGLHTPLRPLQLGRGSGDPGGARVTNPGAGSTVRALGLTSGGSGNCSSGGTTYYQPITEPLSVYGLTLVL